MKQEKKTTDASEILIRRYIGNDPIKQQMLEEERDRTLGEEE